MRNAVESEAGGLCQEKEPWQRLREQFEKGVDAVT